MEANSSTPARDDTPSERMTGAFALPTSACVLLKDIFSRIGPDPEKSIPYLLSLACRLVGAPCALYQSGQGGMPLTYVHGDRLSRNEASAIGAAVRVLGSGDPLRPFSIEDLACSPIGFAAAAAARQGIRSCLVHPVETPGRTRGALAVLFSDVRQFSERESLAVGALASALALIENHLRKQDGLDPSGAESAPQNAPFSLPAGRRTDVDFEALEPASAGAGGSTRPASGKRPRARRNPDPAPSAALRIPVQYRLTPAEMRVAAFIKLKESNKAIADTLGVSIRTVEVHRNNIRRKLGLTRRSVNLKNHLMAMDAVKSRAS